MVFAGPVRPGRSVSIFRATGVSVRRRGGFSGPVRSGRSEEVFRATGRSVLSGSVQERNILQQIVQQREADIRRLQQEKARLQKLESEKARALDKKRLDAIQKAIIQANKRKLSTLERNKFIEEASRIAQQKNVEARRDLTRRIIVLNTALKERTEPPSQELFIQEKVVSTFRRGGRDIPITKVVVVDSEGRVVRDATPEERRTLIISQQALRPTDLPGIGESAQRRLSSIQQKEARGQRLSVKEQIELAVLTTGVVFGGAGATLLNLKQVSKDVANLVVKVAKDPSLLKEIFPAIMRGGERFGQVLKVSPKTAIVKIGANVLLIQIQAGAFRVVGQFTGRALTRLSPRFRGVAKRTITIPSLQKGKTLRIGISRKLGRLSKAEQVALAGKTKTLVSAQADRLVNFIKSRKIIRKPIRGEAKLSKLTKRLLKKFDSRKITAKELIELDRRIRLEAKKGLLERSLFADPKGVARKRFLRLGSEKEASLLDILSGDVSFKTSKPQLLIFEDVIIQAFPKTKIFKSITSKLKSGKVLTQKEAGELLKFQLKKTGKFKPFGFQTTELEVTLAPDEIIKKIKKVAVTLIDGKRVDITQAKVVKATGRTKTLLSKAKSGKITAKELSELRKRLKTETGFTSSISDSAVSLPKVSLGSKAVSIALGTSKRVSGRKAPSRVVTRRKVPVRKAPSSAQLRSLAKARKALAEKRVLRPVKRKPITRLVREPPKRVLVKKPPVTPLVRAKPKKKPKVSKKPTKPVPVFNVFGKSGKKFVKLNVKPLTRDDALDRLTFAIDRTTSQQGKISPVGKSKKPGTLRKGERNYFKRQGFKLREFKIRKGRKFALKNQYIERRKHAIDTASEKAGLSIAKFIKQKGIRKPRRIIPVPRKKPIKRITPKRKPSQAQLSALAKGRAKLKKLRKK